MAYRKCKIYFDGSHHIAIPPQPKKPRPKKGAKVKKEIPELEELDAEDEDCPFDKPVQLSLFDNNDDKRQQSHTKDNPPLTEETTPESSLSADETGQETAQAGETAASPSRKEIFERLYKEHLYDSKRKRKREIIKGMLPYCKDYEDAKLFTELNLRRKRNNLIARRIRMTRKANLQDFTHFVTFTYSDALHTEQSFKKGLGTCLRHYADRKGWKCMGVWERSPEKQRLHFHGIFYIPEGTMPGQMMDVNDFNFKSKKRKITHQNTYFNEHFGRSDFEKIDSDYDLQYAMNYLIKYIEKSGERIVYYGDLPQYLVSDVMEDDIICPYGEDGRKFILAVSFGCWDEGEYMGQVSEETIAKMPKAN